MDSVRVSFAGNSTLNDALPSLGMSMKNKMDPSNMMNQHMTQPPAAAATVPGGFRIFITSQLESRDDLDEKHERCYNLTLGLMTGKSDKESIESLTVAVGKDAKHHEDICLGLLICILTNPTEAGANRSFRDLTHICRDGLSTVLTHLTHLILEKYLKLLPHVKQQLIWLIREMVRANITGMDNVVWNLMRQIAGGDVSRANLWLTDSLLDLYIEHRPWLEKFPFLVASVAYTYLRLIEDHVAPQLEKIREKEVKFVISLVRDRFTDVMDIGRDFVRILQNVAKLPEITELWRDILYMPKVLSPTFTGLSQLMEKRTSRRFLQSRITPEMEKKLFFLTSQVKFGSHKRYQDWFQRQYLFTPESQSLRCDLIRFIVGVIHPSNELLCSDIIPRWAVIGWLLTTCTSQVAASNAKLALFYDWLFFEPEKDNIMNIEPAILVMHHSIKPHPAITATLLDFLCRIITNFFPREQEKVRNGIYSSLRQILEKRVLPSLSPLFDHPKMDQELKFLLRERFSPFVKDQALDRNMDNLDEDHPIIIDSNSYEDAIEDLTGGPEFSDDEPDEAVDDDDKDDASDEVKDNNGDQRTAAALDIPKQHQQQPPPPSSQRKKPNNSNSTSIKKETLSSSTSSTNRPSPVKVRKKPVKSQTSQPQNTSSSALGENSMEDSELSENVIQLLEDLKSSTSYKNSKSGDCENLGLHTEDEEKCEIMDQLIRDISSTGLNFEQCQRLAEKLSVILKPNFEGKIFPATLDEEALEDSVGKPLFVAFRALSDMVDDGESSGTLFQVLADLYALQPRVGYYLLYFLSVDKQSKQREPRTKAHVYKDLCETIDPNYCLDICLVNDMRQCQEDDVELFVHLLPDIYSVFPKTAVGNVNLLYLAVSCVDGRHIQQLVCQIVSKELLLFKKDSFSSIVTSSLAWETFEQCALWQLINAHEVPLDCLISVLPKLNYHKHPEALTATILRLRTEKPTADLVRHVLSREPVVGDRFVCSVLNYWLHGEHEDKLAELVSSFMSKHATGSSSSNSGSASGGLSTSLKRKRGGVGSSSSSTNSGSVSSKAETALMHLDRLRQNCRQYEFFNHPNLQKSIRTFRQLCNDEHKKKFMDLFALAESESEDEEDEQHHVAFSHKHRNKSKSKGGGNGNSTASSSSRSERTSSSKRVHRPLDDDDEDESTETSESENSDEEDTKPLSSSGNRNNRQGTGNSSSSSNNKKTSSNNTIARKRASNKVSYKGMDSSENSSDDDVPAAKKKKWRKKANARDSD